MTPQNLVWLDCLLPNQYPEYSQLNVDRLAHCRAHNFPSAYYRLAAPYGIDALNFVQTHTERIEQNVISWVGYETPETWLGELPWLEFAFPAQQRLLAFCPSRLYSELAHKGRILLADQVQIFDI